LNNEWGDFQTPPELAQEILACLARKGKVWLRALEPTCGKGSFIQSLLRLDTPPREIQAIELQAEHLESARRSVGRPPSTRVVFTQASIFNLDLGRDLCWEDSGPLLVVGNPPWVTNAKLGALESDNLPRKKNLKGLRGIEAITGASNFDIAEYIWIKIIRELACEEPMIALLCKTSVARNVLKFASDADVPILNAEIHLIDAKRWFGAAVDACLFIVEIGSGKPQYEAAVYPDLHTKKSTVTIGIVGGELIADIEAYKELRMLAGACPLSWRQGIKHDASPAMELTRDPAGRLINGLEETVEVEGEYIYPLLKGSDLFSQERPAPKRSVIVTQKRLNEDTNRLARLAPQLWQYLTGHADVFKRRKSSIYRGKPPFAIFGIGDYSFSKYKVGVSGLHKVPRFRAIGPFNNRPVMLDDTCYFVACDSPEQAALVASLLNDSQSLKLLSSLLFPDAKRPVTKRLLQRINLHALLEHTDRDTLLVRANEALKHLPPDERRPWPTTLEEFLTQPPVASEQHAQTLF